MVRPRSRTSHTFCNGGREVGGFDYRHDLRRLASSTGRATRLIERWFKELTDKRLRRGRFTSVADLTEAITTWAAHWNKDPKPFIWKATAADIIAKVQRGRDALNQIKSTTDH